MRTAIHFWAHLCLCTVGSYASLSVCLSVCLSVTRPKITRKKFISCKPFDIYPPNLDRGCIWMPSRLILKVKVIGQRSRSPGQKTWFYKSHMFHNRLTGNVQGQGSWDRVKGHLGQGQRSSWLNLGLRVMILAGGLTPTSSCIFDKRRCKSTLFFYR